MTGRASFPLIVEIAFGAGPMDPDPLDWTDVSAYVRRSETISLQRGRDPQSGEPSGRGQIRFKNPDGRFTLGATGVFGLVRNRLPIRVRSTYTILWTGLVEKWGQATDAGVRSTVDATLVDRWPRMKQRKLSGDRLQQVCQSMRPARLYPFTDVPGSGRASNVLSGVDVGSDLVPVIDAERGLTAPTWSAVENPQGGALQNVISLPGECAFRDPGGVPMGSRATISAWVRLPSALAAPSELTVGLFGLLFVSMGVKDGAPFLWGSVTYPPTLTSSVTPACDSSWHHIAVTADGAHPTTGDLVLFFDGLPVHAANWATGGTWNLGAFMWVTGSNAHLGYVTVFDRVLTFAEIAAIHGCGIDALGNVGDLADSRKDIICAAFPPGSVGQRAGVFAATMSRQTVDGMSQADLLLACARAEDGTLHIGIDGWPVLTPRVGRVDAQQAEAIPATVIAHDVAWELDDQSVTNVVTVERMALDQVASTVTRRNDISVDTYGEVPSSLQLWVDTDAQAIERANATVTIGAEAAPRTRAFTVDLMTCGAAINPETLQGVDVGSRIYVYGLPGVYPAGQPAGYYVDDIADEITATSWRRTFTVTPALDFLIIDDPTFGGLDERPLG